MENINIKAGDLRIEATENGFLVLVQSGRDPYAEGQVLPRYVFEDLPGLFAFIDSHFILPDTKTDPTKEFVNSWEIDGPVYGGGS